MAKNGDLWRQSSLEVTGTAKNIWGPYATGGAKVPVDITIQNNDATGIVYVNLSGAATVSSAMFMIRPGDSMSFKNVINTVSVIGSIASNTVAFAVVRNGG